jgi:hypothetical protein
MGSVLCAAGTEVTNYCYSYYYYYWLISLVQYFVNFIPEFYTLYWSSKLSPRNILILMSRVSVVIVVSVDSIILIYTYKYNIILITKTETFLKMSDLIQIPPVVYA